MAVFECGAVLGGGQAPKQTRVVCRDARVHGHARVATATVYAASSYMNAAVHVALQELDM